MDQGTDDLLEHGGYQTLRLEWHLVVRDVRCRGNEDGIAIVLVTAVGLDVWMTWTFR